MAARKKGPAAGGGSSGLTREAFIRAATEIVEESGMQAYTARTLAERLGVDPTAVYRYFPSVESVLAAVVDELIFGVEAPSTGTPREQIEALLLGVHERFWAHPNLVPLLVSARDPLPNGATLSAAFVTMLERLGLHGDDLVLCHRMLESALIGTHSFDLGAAPMHLETRRARMRGIDNPDLDRALPTLTAVAELNQRAFRTSITVLLDYCETLVGRG
ncbi:MAG: TetR/AcrR family transcriptional regulator [Ilumatobacteraceae bacterium]